MFAPRLFDVLVALQNQLAPANHPGGHMDVPMAERDIVKDFLERGAASPNEALRQITVRLGCDMYATMKLRAILAVFKDHPTVRTACQLCLADLSLGQHRAWGPLTPLVIPADLVARELPRFIAPPPFADDYTGDKDRRRSDKAGWLIKESRETTTS